MLGLRRWMLAVLVSGAAYDFSELYPCGVFADGAVIMYVDAPECCGAHGMSRVHHNDGVTRCKITMRATADWNLDGDIDLEDWAEIQVRFPLYAGKLARLLGGPR